MIHDVIPGLGAAAIGFGVVMTNPRRGLSALVKLALLTLALSGLWLLALALA